MLFTSTKLVIIAVKHLHTLCLIVFTVIECRNLPPMDPNGLADPYVKVSILSTDGTEKNKQKTERKEKNLDPKYDETFFL